MKKFYLNHLFLVFFCLGTLIILMSNSSGRGNVFGQAVTGAPGDSNLTCGTSGCHSSNNFTPQGSMSVFNLEGNEVSDFTPGETYDVVLSIQTTGNPSAYGFQMVALNEDNSPATNWQNIGNNAQIVQIGDRNYLEHNSPSSLNEFSTQWIAPETGKGDVTFYFAVNAVNGNGSPSSDGASNSTFSLSERTTSSKNLESVSISVFPNPASDLLTILGGNDNYSFSIFNIQGKSITTSNLEETSVVDVSKFRSGLYFIKIHNGSKIITKKFFKQ